MRHTTTTTTTTTTAAAAAAIVAILGTAPALADQLQLPADWPANVKSLIARSEAANSRCRGGGGDEATTLKACDQRKVLGRQIDRLGYCKGRAGQYGYEMWWRRCGPDSDRAAAD